MMFFMNLCSSILMGVYLTLVLPSLSVLSEVLPISVSSKDAAYELWNALDFLKVHPDALVDVLMFSVAGALGQCFIFYVLAKFESRVLVTINVTRKMMTIMLSVIWFGHSLNMLQYFSVSLVFIAIFIEGFYGGKSKGKDKKEKVEEDEVVDMGDSAKLKSSSATKNDTRTRRKAKKDE
ncbi:hypothetical protein MP638_005261 [Amoeboaphelidium occidentale]|nr:hypothetical protein MP638_005261 [Amoeboaphelidium occidentale]